MNPEDRCDVCAEWIRPCERCERLLGQTFAGHRPKASTLLPKTEWARPKIDAFLRQLWTPKPR